MRFFSIAVVGVLVASCGTTKIHHSSAQLSKTDGSSMSGSTTGSVKTADVGGDAVGSAIAPASDGKPQSTTLVASQSAWNGTPYLAYPPGRPQLTVLKILIPAHTSLPWHTHVVPNAAYVLSGHLTVEDRATGRKLLIGPGEAFAESIGVVHRGVTGEEAAEIVVTYAATADTPLSVPAAGEKPEFGD